MQKDNVSVSGLYFFLDDQTENISDIYTEFLPEYMAAACAI